MAERLIAMICGRLLRCLRRRGPGCTRGARLQTARSCGAGGAIVSVLSEEGADQEAAGAEQADWCRLLRFPKVLQVAA